MNTPTQNLLQIDRSTPFNPTTFIGVGWSVVEEDETSLALKELDLNKVFSKTTVQSIKLDAKVFQILWEKQQLIPEYWKDGDPVTFAATILRCPKGEHYVLCLYWCEGGWNWGYRWLDDAL